MDGDEDLNKGESELEEVEPEPDAALECSDGVYLRCAASGNSLSGIQTDEDKNMSGSKVEEVGPGPDGALSFQKKNPNSVYLRCTGSSLSRIIEFGIGTPFDRS